MLLIFLISGAELFHVQVIFSLLLGFCHAENIKSNTGFISFYLFTSCFLLINMLQSETEASNAKLWVSRCRDCDGCLTLVVTNLLTLNLYAPPPTTTTTTQRKLPSTPQCLVPCLQVTHWSSGSDFVWRLKGPVCQIWLDLWFFFYVGKSWTYWP